MKYNLLLFILIFNGFSSFAQDESHLIKSIFNDALTDRTAYETLRTLCKEHKGRVTGSPEANEAVDYMYKTMETMGFDTVYKQPVQVPRWVRGDAEKAFILSSNSKKIEVPVTALGISIGTGEKGLQAEVVEVYNFDELTALGNDKVKGKIVFFNFPMDQTKLNTFSAYGESATYRTQAAAKAAEFGAVGTIVRSPTTAQDDFPHTGVMRYAEGVEKIPAVSISTNGADLLSKQLSENPELEFYFRTTCKTMGEVESYNVIGEIKGSEFPDQIITVGGHLDAWESGEGAHDDGAGCVQSIEVLRLFKELGIKPKRTIRAVMFMDEEVAQRGGKEYAKQAGLKGENHYFALESDRGGLMPRGFGVSAPNDRIEQILALKKYFAPYGIYEFTKGGGGVDISPLKEYDTPLSSFIPDMQRYFDYHHSGFDTFEQVNIRELQMGSAAIASFIYLIDKFDL